jgi:PAS domain S-box-containing protein
VGAESRRAVLQAILGEAYYQVERQVEARNAANQGLDFLGSRPDSDVLKSRLLITRMLVAETSGEIAGSVADASALLKVLPTPSLPHSCALLARAQLNQAQNRLDLAVADALTAYRETGSNHWLEARALAAESFGSFYADTGDLDEARRFLKEALDYAAGLNATNWLSVLYYDFGRLDLRAADYPATIHDMERSSAMSAAVGDQRSVSMSKVISCIAYTRAGEPLRAKPLCDAAENELRGSDRPDLYKSAIGAHANLDLALHQPAVALTRLDRVFEHDGNDIEPRTLPPHLLNRALAHAALGDYRLAYQDLSRFNELTVTGNALDRRRAIAILRTRFETERANERSRVLQRENDEQRELLARRAEINRLWVAMAAVGALVIGLLIFSLRTRQRHSQVLEAQAMILHSMSEGVMLLEAGGKLRAVNVALERAFGYTTEEFRALDLATLGIDADPRIRPVTLPLECLLRRKDGSEFPGIAAFTSLAPDNPGQFICVIQDITEAKRLERALVDVSVREQRHLGQELHDGLGQELTGLALLARGLATTAQKNRLPIAAELSNLSSIASRAIETCRGMARGLSPAGEVQGGLPQALQDLGDRIAIAHSIRVNVRPVFTAPLALTPESSDHVYRIAQEALNNAVKHANARCIDVELEVSPSKARLTIEDDGIGMRPELEVSAGLGLRTMRYRASLIGARFSIGPAEPYGTLITCEWPQA